MFLNIRHIPFSGRNPVFQESLDVRPHLLILNKMDLADMSNKQVTYLCYLNSFWYISGVKTWKMSVNIFKEIPDEDWIIAVEYIHHTVYTKYLQHATSDIILIMYLLSAYIWAEDNPQHLKVTNTQLLLYIFPAENPEEARKNWSEECSLHRLSQAERWKHQKGKSQLPWMPNIWLLAETS